MEALKEVEETIVHDVSSSLVTSNVVGSVTIPSSPPLSISVPYLTVLAVLVTVLFFTDAAIKARTPTVIVTKEFKAFQTSYIRVYLCALGAEWLQDSHLFALLLRHGHSLRSVASLFAASFAVSYAWGLLGAALPGSSLGALFGGRRASCLACFASYALAAVTVFHDDFSTLLLGRFFYGTATALLHTVFDAWMNSEHAAQAFPDEWLGQTYSEVARLTVSVSVGSGLLAEACAALSGLAAPFVASLCLSAAGAALVKRTWPMQTGDGVGQCFRACVTGGGLLNALGSGLVGGVQNLAELARGDDHRATLLLVAVQASFETAMYIVLFQWTPMVNASTADLVGVGVPPPYGIIFALLMASLMVGSHLFQLGVGSSPFGGAALSPEKFCLFACALACGCCLLAALVWGTAHWVGLGALVAFEACVGVYYPAIGYLRGKHVPFESRGVAGHCAKTLLALLVLSLLLSFADLAAFVFLACAALLAGAVAALQMAEQGDGGGPGAKQPSDGFGDFS